MSGPPEPWLHVIGIDDSGPACLPPRSLALVEAAETLVGGERHHALFPEARAERLTWQRPIEASLEQIAARRGRRVVVLASGDPFCFGIGRALSRRFGVTEMRVVPAPSSVALACARLHWSRPDVEVLSLSNGAPAQLARHLWPGRRMIVLARDEGTPLEVARILRERGYGPSRIVILEHLGGARERCLATSADAFEPARIARLNLIAVECVAAPGARPLPRVPGLPDDVYQSDGMLTRSEVRAITLARLQPGPGQLLIDVGAGSGSVAIEWLRAAVRARAMAIERDAGRRSIIERNAEALGTPELRILADEAPACLDPLEMADAVFVGGGLATPGMLDACLGKLRAGGRLVANAVTLEGEQALFACRAAHGGDLTRIALARLEPVGRLEGWRPAMPVTQLALVRP